MVDTFARTGMDPEWTAKGWRRRPDLNRGWRFCRPLPYHLATAPVGTRLYGRVRPRLRGGYDSATRGGAYRSFAASGSAFALRRDNFRPPWILRRKLERETGFEPATSTLARSHSTTELFPPATKS